MRLPHEDPYHCNCFAIDATYTGYLKDQLLNNGYHDPFQEDHGQLFGLATNIDDKLQFHLKTMPNGRIEAELEPQTKFVEHLNQEYSSPAHFQVKQVLDMLHIPYQQIQVSFHCLSGKIKKPSKTTSVIGAILVGIGVIAALAIVFSKK